MKKSTLALMVMGVVASASVPRTGRRSSSAVRKAGSLRLASSSPVRYLVDALNAVNLDIAKGTDMKRNLLSGMVLFMLSASVMAQQSFSTPDRATDALTKAISEQNESAMTDLLGENWREMLHDGFQECMRVLKPDGVLIFKWAETQIPAADVWAAIGERPLFGHHSGKKSQTFWGCFMKLMEE